MREKNTFEQQLHQMHLQWFAEGDDTAVADDSLTEPVDEQDALNQIENRDYDVEFVVEDDPEEEAKPNPQQQVEERFGQLQQQLQQMQQNGSSNDQLASVLADMGETLKELRGGNEQKKQQEQPKPFSKDEIIQKYSEEEFYKNPAAAVLDILDQYTQGNIAPAYGQLFNQVQQIMPQIGKMQLAQNDEYQMVLNDWGDEVDAEVQRLNQTVGPNQQNLKTAVELVSGRHMNEIFQRKMEAADQAQQQQQQQPKKQSRPRGLNPLPNGASPPPQPRGNPNQVRVTRSKMAEVEQWASTKPISVDAALQLWRENGWL
jgi:hypothetical protein